MQVDNNPGLLARGQHTTTATPGSPETRVSKHPVALLADTQSEEKQRRGQPPGETEDEPRRGEPLSIDTVAEDIHKVAQHAEDSERDVEDRRRSRGLSLVEEVQEHMVKGWTFG